MGLLQNSNAELVPTQLANRRSFDLNQIIVGEFGMWLGTHTGEGANNWYFTEQNQADYYNAYYQALEAVGIKWTAPYEAFMSPAHYYGFISAGTSYDTKPSGTPYAAYYTIAANYAGDTFTPYTPTPTLHQHLHLKHHPQRETTATFGTTTIGNSATTFDGSIPRATQYTPTTSGTLTNIMLYITSSGTGGHAQVAIYTDNGNKPGTLLAKSSSDTITSNGWHDFSGFNVPITGGTKYWLACESDTYKLAWHYNNGGANYYQGTAGSYGTFPNPYTGSYGGSYTTSIYATYTTSGNTPTPYTQHLHQHQHLKHHPQQETPQPLEQQQSATQPQHLTAAYQEQPNTHQQPQEHSQTSCYT